MGLSRIKLLIIDDDKDILRLYSLYFKRFGFNVIGRATNGMEAICFLKDSNLRPDLILIDYHMPGMNGIDTSKLILELDKSHKIMMISGDSSIKNEAFSIGVVDFHAKSGNIRNLCKKIKRIA